jgi:hypothetical protein
VTLDISSVGDGAAVVEVPAKLEAQPGEVVVAPIRLAPVADPVASIRVTLSFDPAIVELVDEPGPLAAYSFSITHGVAGEITLEVSGLDAAAVDLESIVNLEFRVRDDALPGSQASIQIDSEVLETLSALAANALPPAYKPEDENP